MTTQAESLRVRRRLPEWLKVKRPGNSAYLETKSMLRALNLHTVCEEARCPNIGDCFGHRTATFMLMGEICTRGCKYCAVSKGRPRAIDSDEPEHLAEAVSKLGLKHVVLTSVDRDDLADGGAEHFANTAKAIKRTVPQVRIEALIPDFRGNRENLRAVLESPVDILNHNTETVPRLYPEVRGGGRYEWTLNILRWSKELRPELPTKSGLMLGLGEDRTELLLVFRDLRLAGCDVLTLGQYLQPTPKHREVSRILTPAEFDELKFLALEMGFAHAESGPLVRSSYHAWEYAI
ncbi:MAG: lipoyl synthase [Candidatus Omnitrophica bacterium]|nr:lipoyl synthase [Candidatus Omnitrophota bacterium]